VDLLQEPFWQGLGRRPQRVIGHEAHKGTLARENPDVIGDHGAVFQRVLGDLGLDAVGFRDQKVELDTSDEVSFGLVE
jgi:hypothetical protein